MEHSIDKNGVLTIKVNLNADATKLPRSKTGKSIMYADTNGNVDLPTGHKVMLKVFKVDKAGMPTP